MTGRERTTGTSRSSMRSDAEQNRVRILEAARTALDSSGNATMQSIAKLAGIGQGTLYRHFPTREALVMAVHRHDVRELVDAAPALLDAHPPFDALRLWFDRLAAYGRIKHGLAGALHTVMRAELAGEGYDPVVGAIDLLLHASKEDGAMRPDVDPEEVLLLVGFLWRIDLDSDWETRSRHMLDLVMDALRPQPNADL
jgi:AcrR family transcriptional regulator